MLVGNKCDEDSSREVDASICENLSKQWQCGYMETSAKNNTNVKELFQVSDIFSFPFSPNPKLSSPARPGPVEKRVASNRERGKSIEFYRQLDRLHTCAVR